MPLESNWRAKSPLSCVKYPNSGFFQFFLQFWNTVICTHNFSEKITPAWLYVWVYLCSCSKFKHFTSNQWHFLKYWRNFFPIISGYHLLKSKEKLSKNMLPAQQQKFTCIRVLWAICDFNIHEYHFLLHCCTQLQLQVQLHKQEIANMPLFSTNNIRQRRWATGKNYKHAREEVGQAQKRRAHTHTERNWK